MVGPTLLLTRPRAAGEAFAAQVRARHRDLRILIAPLLTIETLAPDPPQIAPAGALITSSNALPALERMIGRATPVWTVGESTAARARALGYGAHCAGDTAEALIDRLIAAAPPAPLLHLRGAHSRGDIARRLTEAGLATGESVVYAQQRRPLDRAGEALLKGKAPVIAPLFSPRSAKIFADTARDAKSPLHLIALSTAVAEAANALTPASMRIARAATAAAMLEVLSGYLDAPGSP